MEMSRLELREGRFASGILASAAILWIGSLGCASLGPPKPQSDYRAQVEVRIGDASAAEIRVVRLVEYGREGKRRRDLTLDRPIVWIDRPDLRITWILQAESSRSRIHSERAYASDSGIWAPKSSTTSRSRSSQSKGMASPAMLG
jgi:hypothetical protein